MPLRTQKPFIRVDQEGPNLILTHFAVPIRSRVVTGRHTVAKGDVSAIVAAVNDLLERQPRLIRSPQE